MRSTSKPSICGTARPAEPNYPKRQSPVSLQIAEIQLSPAREENHPCQVLASVLDELR